MRLKSAMQKYVFNKNSDDGEMKIKNNKKGTNQ